MEESQGPTLEEILIPIWANRKRILLISLIVGLVTLGINFLLPVYYKSTATLLPETQKDKLSALGQFADIASLAGVSVPGSEIARLYPTILLSETVLRNVISYKYSTAKQSDSIDLIRYFSLEDKSAEHAMYEAISIMRELVKASHDNRTSTVTITAEMPEPKLASDVLNRCIFELDQFMRTKRMSGASEQVRWIELRLAEVKRDLRESEEALKVFRERNRKVTDSPELMLHQERLIRDAQVQSTIYIELRKQFELAKLEEIKNLSIVNVLDPGRAPVRKDRPKRATNSALAFVLALVSSSGYFGTRKWINEFATRHLKFHKN